MTLLLLIAATFIWVEAPRLATVLVNARHLNLEEER